MLRALTAVASTDFFFAPFLPIEGPRCSGNCHHNRSVTALFRLQDITLLAPPQIMMSRHGARDGMEGSTTCMRPRQLNPYLPCEILFSSCRLLQKCAYIVTLNMNIEPLLVLATRLGGGSRNLRLRVHRINSYAHFPASQTLSVSVDLAA